LQQKKKQLSILFKTPFLVGAMQGWTTRFRVANLLCSRFGEGETRRQSLDCPDGLLGSCWDQSPPWRGRPAGWLGAVLPGPRGRPIDSCHHTRAGSPAESMGNMGAFGRGDFLSGPSFLRRQESRHSTAGSLHLGVDPARAESTRLLAPPGSNSLKNLQSLGWLDSCLRRNDGALGRGDVLSAFFAPGRRALWRRGLWGQGPYRRQVGLVLAWSAAR
jgi:hypothetical protein